MDGAELTKSEFAYLLAIVHATEVVGVDDPALFPTKAKARDSTYGEGRAQLEENGWLKPIPEYTDEYDLNPALLQMVSIVAAPTHVLGTRSGEEDEDRHWMLHYVSGDQIVELWAPTKESYILAVVPDIETLQSRLGEMLQLTEASRETEFSLEEPVLEQIRALAQKGKADQAGELLVSAGVDGASDSLIAALAGPASGQIFVVRPVQGAIEAGRRTDIYGIGDSAWRINRAEADSEEFEIATCDPGTIGDLVNKWIEELTEE